MEVLDKTGENQRASSVIRLERHAGDRYIVVISDCHLSAGRFVDEMLNPHEDFHFDGEMVDLFEHFSTGVYGEREGRPVHVDLIIAGDYFDFLNVPLKGEFEDAVTEEVAISKLEAIIQGHPRVMEALRAFAARPGKRITYLIGNHDADLFFPRVRERIVREWAPAGEFPSERVQVIADTDRLTFDCGVEIRHGNQFEAGSILNFNRPLLTEYLEQPVLNIPWSSFYVLKVVNRLKWEREYLDKVRPVKLFVFFGLIVDPLFTLKFVFLSMFYFIQTRFVWSPVRRARLAVTLEIVKQESQHVFLDLEKEAREVLDSRRDLKTIIFGHTHRPMNKVYPDGKQYINTGTWTKMVNLDWRGIGQSVRRTFALVKIDSEGRANAELRQWVGEHSPHQSFDG